MKTTDIRAVKESVRDRDGQRCTLCGMTAAEHLDRFGFTLEVHRRDPGSIYTVDGCFTVCRPCHGSLPKRRPGQPDLANRSRRTLKIFRLTPESVAELEAASQRLGMSETAVLEVLIRQAAKHVKPPDVDPAAFPPDARGKRGLGRRRRP